MIEDYRIYKFSKKEAMTVLVQGLLGNALIAFLFYNSFWAMIPGMVVIAVYWKERKRKFATKRMRKMRTELQEFFHTLIAALQTGRSMENAFFQGTKDLRTYLGEDTELTEELKRICAAVSVGQPLEKLLLEFADRSTLEELEYFAEVYTIAKRSGGNLIAIMKNTLRMLQERMDVEEEIYTLTTEAQLEFYIMCVIPFAIIVYLRLGAGNLLESLYGNTSGIVVMTLCLGLYGGCYLYGKRLLEIKN